MVILSRILNAFIFQYFFFMGTGILLYILVYLLTDQYVDIDIKINKKENVYVTVLAFLIPIVNAVITVAETQIIINYITERYNNKNN